MYEGIYNGFIDFIDGVLYCYGFGGMDFVVRCDVRWCS